MRVHYNAVRAQSLKRNENVLSPILTAYGFKKKDPFLKQALDGSGLAKYFGLK
jgi:hypothetical protein